jgi:hypothetical protein
VFVNPLNEHRRMPPGEPIPAAALESFHAARDPLSAQMADLRDGDVVLAQSER